LVRPDRRVRLETPACRAQPVAPVCRVRKGSRERPALMERSALKD